MLYCIFVCIMAITITNSDKQYLAKILYTREQLDAKVVAKRVGTSEKTMSKWVNDFGWKNLRKRLLVSKEQILNDLYEELEELGRDIKENDEGKRYGNPAQNDSRVKLTASIRNLETDLSIADLVESGIRFIKHLQAVGTMEQVMDVADLWNSFLQNNIKR